MEVQVLNPADCPVVPLILFVQSTYRSLGSTNEPLSARAVRTRFFDTLALRELGKIAENRREGWVYPLTDGENTHFVGVVRPNMSIEHLKGRYCRAIEQMLTKDQKQFAVPLYGDLPLNELLHICQCYGNRNKVEIFVLAR